ncbi:MAG: methylglyoxal synthase [Clostridia bacterium]|nr:methylglyoxal synthase [Clostridia bacterium]MBR7165193.1 methylglyoxal synthase [Clostridia bacterium]
MQIALIAQDDKKELMAQLCIAYSGILSKHALFATATTGRIVSEATGLSVETLLGGASGGREQINSRIAYGEIDIVLYLRSAGAGEELDVYDAELIRLCDAYNLPLATNLATAETIIMALGRGDLDWRENMR